MKYYDFRKQKDINKEFPVNSELLSTDNDNKKSPFPKECLFYINAMYFTPKNNSLTRHEIEENPDNKEYHKLLRMPVIADNEMAFLYNFYKLNLCHDNLDLFNIWTYTEIEELYNIIDTQKPDNLSKFSLTPQKKEVIVSVNSEHPEQRNISFYKYNSEHDKEKYISELSNNGWIIQYILTDKEIKSFMNDMNKALEGKYNEGWDYLLYSENPGRKLRLFEKRKSEYLQNNTVSAETQKNIDKTEQEHQKYVRNEPCMTDEEFKSMFDLWTSYKYI